MNSKILFFSIVFFYGISLKSQNNGQRYLNEVFTNVKISTVQYGRNASLIGDTIPLLLDLYEPDGDQAQKRAAIVLAFGGAFVTGDRTQLADVARNFARNGYVVACIDYRIWPVFVLGFPDSAAIVDVSMKAISDMKAAIRFLRAESNKYKIDTDKIIAGGVSAGAITAIHVGYLNKNDSISPGLRRAIERNGGYEGNSNNNTLGYSSTVAGIINLSGAILDLDFIDEGEPPMASMHGTADQTVPYSTGKAAGILTMNGSGAIEPILNSKKIDHVLITVPGGGHQDIYIDPKFSAFTDTFYVNGKRLFFDAIINQTVASRQDALIHQTMVVYPNPAINKVHYISNETPRYIRMFDLTGRQVPIQSNPTAVSWNQSLSGIYTLEFIFKNGISRFVKVIVRS